MKYYQDEWVTQYCGDALVVLPKLESGSIDLLCTDPPYGIGFMGKDWDKALPDKQIWAECYRVLKAGAFAFVMSIPRADCLSRMIISLEDAGFWVNFTPIFWAYASGFPKAQNIGKAVDKRNGRVTDEYRALGNYLRNQRGNRPQKDIAQFFLSKTGGLTGCVANWELGFNVPTKEQWIILKRELNLDNRFDELIEREEAEREVIGYGQYHNPDARQNWGGEGYKRNQIITQSATPQAKALDGSYGGFQPKPAVEVIIVAMKPLSEKTFVDQALKNGKGITWLDDGRIPYDGTTARPVGKRLYDGWGLTGKDLITGDGAGRFPANLLTSDSILDYNEVCINEDDTPIAELDLNKGKGGIGAKAKPLEMPLFMESPEVKKQNGESLKPSMESLNPQNTNKPSQEQGLNSMIDEGENRLEAISDEEPIIDGERQSLKETGINAKSVDTEEEMVGEGDSMPTISKPSQDTPSLSMKSPMESPFVSPVIERQKTSDSRDNFSRFFDLDKWAQKTFPFLIVPKASKSEKDRGLDIGKQRNMRVNAPRESEEEKFATKLRNYHPTVKPLKLMSYLITLGSRPSDIVLDPFGGSGTTAKASKLLGRHCIIVEIKEKYCEIAANRCRQMVMELWMEVNDGN